MTTTTTQPEFTRTYEQNHDRFSCPACGVRVMRSRRVARWTAGAVVITQCTACPAPVVAAPVTVAPVVPAAPARRRNAYPGTCECGRHVPAGRGYLENDGGWHVCCGGCGLSSSVG